MIEKTQEQLLNELENIENQIKEAKKITKQYDELKKEIKNAMLKAAKENNLEQIKWETPTGTKITLSVGHCAEFEKKMVKEFDIEKLKTFYEDIYNECFTEKEKSVMIKNASDDKIRITLAKGDK